MSYLVFDFGGTLTKFAVINGDGQIAFKDERPSGRSLNELLEHVKLVFNYTSLKYGHIKGIGMSIPAVTDADKGIIVSEGALKYVKNVELKKCVEALLNVPVEMENDGNCAALAEAYDGAAALYERSAVVVCGTGIGGALINDKKIIKGAHLHAGEFGYNTLIMDSGTGQIGTWSEHGSVGALVNRVNKRKGVHSKLSGEEIFVLAESGDDIAIEEIDRYYLIMAMGVHSVQYSIDPDVILLGGGISRRPDFIERMEEKLDHIYVQMPHASVRPILKCCKHFNDANLLGAYYNLISRQEQ